MTSSEFLLWVLAYVSYMRITQLEFLVSKYFWRNKIIEAQDKVIEAQFEVILKQENQIANLKHIVQFAHEDLANQELELRKYRPIAGLIRRKKAKVRP